MQTATPEIPDLYRWLAPAIGPIDDADAARVSGPRSWWGGPLDVEGLALGSVRTALTAAQLAFGRTERFHTDSASVAAAFASLDHLRVAGRAPEGFAPMSGYFQARDGWVRLHANYPHHARALSDALGVSTKEELTATIASLPADEIAERVTVAGGLAVTLRAPQDWRAGPQGRYVDTQPWIRFDLTDVLGPALESGRRLAGVRILDLTRVIAGPVATRFLALLGADVLRVDPPAIPELIDQYIDSGFGKRSATADFADRVQREKLTALLRHADAVIMGYRPGTLAEFGLDPVALRERFPGLLVVTLDAWGDQGPWGGRRGFDSLVQCATGIGRLYGRTDSDGGWRPGALPVQALDHASGYGVAAATLALLARRSTAGAGSAHLCLARTAHLLLDLPATRREGRELPVPRAEAESVFGRLSFAAPPAFSGGDRIGYSAPPGPYGADALEWQTSS
ncbi:CoA transferase [Mycolicibacterium mageritense]|uniref:CoA transferase n=1 Tax=Mycolicibacterium mageritense TaxID=53462 RepID=UPI001E592AAB|nr:CoA transferase [Mycolicibacterium mageritense]MCC9179636.1 CoA transferase [Mycolicibacterium mageritense]